MTSEDEYEDDLDDLEAKKKHKHNDFGNYASISISEYLLSNAGDDYQMVDKSYVGGNTLSRSGSKKNKNNMKKS